MELTKLPDHLTRLNIPTDILLEWSSTGKVGHINPVQDHEGTWFPNLTQMLKHYKLARATYDYRESKGYTLAERLTTPIGQVLKTATSPNYSVTIKGISYDSMAKFAELKNVSLSTMLRRKGLLEELGLSIDYLEDWSDYTHWTYDKDHAGVVYPTKLAMCEAYGLTKPEFERYLDKYKDLRTALLYPTLKAEGQLPDLKQD